MNNKDLFIYLRVRPEVSPVSSSAETLQDYKPMSPGGTHMQKDHIRTLKIL